MGLLHFFKYLNSVALSKHSFSMENHITHASVLMVNTFYCASEKEPQNLMDLLTSSFIGWDSK
jgi:hypothetical protein